MDSTHALKGLLMVAVLFFVSVIAIGLVTAGDPDNRSPIRPTGTLGYTHEELQRAADMTQQMSAPNANTGSPIHTLDEQLARSQSAGYVQAVEQHQSDIDRMLAQGTP